MRRSVVTTIKSSLFACRAYPQVILVDLEPLPAGLVHPFLDPAGPLLPARLGQVLPGKIGLQFRVSGGRVMSHRKRLILSCLYQHTFNDRQIGTPEDLGHLHSKLKFR